MKNEPCYECMLANIEGLAWLWCKDCGYNKKYHSNIYVNTSNSDLRVYIL